MNRSISRGMPEPAKWSEENNAVKTSGNFLAVFGFGNPVLKPEKMLTVLLYPCCTKQTKPGNDSGLHPSLCAGFSRFSLVESEGFEPSSKQRIPMSSTCLGWCQIFLVDSLGSRAENQNPWERNLSAYYIFGGLSQFTFSKLSSKCV